MLYTLEGSHCMQPTLKEGKYYFFCIDLSILPIYLFNHLFLSAWTNGYLFYPFTYNSILQLCILSFRLFQGTLSFGCCVSLTYPTIVDFFLEHFLIANLFWIFPVPFLESVIPPRTPSSLFWRIILKIKIWALSVLIVTEVSLILRFSADRARKYTQVYCIYSHLYIHIYKYVFIKSSVFISKLNMTIYWGLQL